MARSPYPIPKPKPASVNGASSSEFLTNAQKYPKYFRDVSELDSVDTYEINRLFPVDDPSGAVLHARKKLLIPGHRTGGKTMYQDIKEARDTLNRWLEMNQE